MSELLSRRSFVGLAGFACLSRAGAVSHAADTVAKQVTCGPVA